MTIDTNNDGCSIKPASLKKFLCWYCPSLTSLCIYHDLLTRNGLTSSYETQRIFRRMIYCTGCPFLAVIIYVVVKLGALKYFSFSSRLKRIINPLTDKEKQELQKFINIYPIPDLDTRSKSRFRWGWRLFWVAAVIIWGVTW